MPDFDVVVAGGGLAGARAAQSLARRGVRTLVIERKEDPGDLNYCAEGVSARALKPLVEVTDDLIAAPIDGGLLVGPGQTQARLLWSGVGFVLHRDRLMRRVYEDALSAGAEGRLGSEVVDVERGDDGRLAAVIVRRGDGRDRVPCRAVVAADGVASGVGRLAGIPTRLAVGEMLSCAQYRMSGVEVEAGMPEFWIGDEFAPGGYAWVFPRSDGEANVGVGIVADRPSAAGKSATAWLKRFRRERFGGTGHVDTYLTGGIPTLVRPVETAAQGVVLAGDAARAADPLSGAGIAEALDSGRRAGQCLAEVLSQGDPTAARLQGAWKSYAKAHPRLPLMRAIRRIFDALDDSEKAELTRAAREAFHDKPIDALEPRTLFLQLLRMSPKLLKYARHLVSRPTLPSSILER